MKIITRGEAKAQGLKYYFPGSTCKNGHIDRRRTDNGQCMQCRHDAYWHNRDKVLSECKRRYDENPEKVRRRVREYRKNNLELDSAARRKKYHSNLQHRLKCRMQCLLARSLKASDGKKTKKTNEMLGYRPEELRLHIEKQFVRGMGWHNYGDWHIDHITPIKWFTDNGVTDPSKINCLTNLRPVWAIENLRKRDTRTHLI